MNHIQFFYLMTALLSNLAFVVLAIHSFVIARLLRGAYMWLVAVGSVVEAGRRIYSIPVTIALLTDVRLDELIPLSSMDLLISSAIGMLTIWSIAVGMGILARAIWVAEPERRVHLHDWMVPWITRRQGEQ